MQAIDPQFSAWKINVQEGVMQSLRANIRARKQTRTIPYYIISISLSDEAENHSECLSYSVRMLTALFPLLTKCQGPNWCTRGVQT